MVQYNILANATFKSLTGPSEGDVELMYNDFISLYDGNYNSTVIDLTASGTLYLEIDFGSRFRLDSFNAYVNTSSGVLDNINLYYKNYNDDAYTVLVKDYNGTFYYASELTQSFAPQKLLFTVTGVDGYLSEIVSNNEDYSVSFGEDGTQTVVDISDSDSSNTSDSHILKIKNTSTVNAATAYVCVDYTGKPEDSFLKVSSDNINFFGITDGISLNDDVTSHNYNWSHGVLDNISIVNRDYLELTDKTTGSIGIYTTPIFCTELTNDFNHVNGVTYYNKFDSSFIVTTTTSPTNTNIKVDVADQDFTMEVRSTNTDPLNYEKIVYVDDMLVVTSTTATCSVYLLDVSTHIQTLLISDLPLSTAGSGLPRVFDIAVSPFNGNLCVITFSWYYYAAYYTMHMLDPENNIIGSSNPQNYGTMTKSSLCEYSRGGWLWFLFSSGANLVVYDKYAEEQLVINDVVAFSTDKLINSNASWMLKLNEHSATKVSNYNTQLYSLNITSPKLISGNFDGGCWIYEDATSTLNKFDQDYNEAGNITYFKTATKKIDLYQDQTITCISNDYSGKDGVWYCINSMLYHLDNKGALITETHVNFDADSIKCTQLGALVRKYDVGAYCYVGMDGVIKDHGTTEFSMTTKGVTFEQFLQLDTNLLPVANDPVWDPTIGNLEWKKTTLSGYFLPKTKYHQIRLTLRTDQTGSSPLVSSVVIPKPVVVTDIQKGATKNVYLKTEFTGNEAPYEYNTKLKCWWNIQSD